MASRRFLLVMVILLAAGCGAPDDMGDDALVASVLSTQVNALPSVYQWLFDNESGCAVEIVISEATLTEMEGTDIGKQLENWRSIIVPAASQNTPVDALVLGPDYDGSFLWPLTLSEYVAPGGTADPTCDWLPKEVQVEAPHAGKNAVVSVITAQGEVKTK